jgi:putative Holliday junction resolvase
MGKLLAIDYGTKRTGIAVTDDFKIIASGLKTVNTSELIVFLKNYCDTNNVDKFIIGLPKQMNNTPSESEIYIQKFLRLLEKEIPNIPVERTDERFTSKMAFQTMIDGGLSKKQRKNKALVDEISATLILQSYMASH